MSNGGDPSTAADTTGQLVARAQDGDATAMDDLFRRHVPQLNRWARGRLPSWARDLTDTHDLVQDTVLQTFKRMRAFEWRGKGALRVYLRQALMNRLRNEIRHVSRRPTVEAIDHEISSQKTSPLQEAIRREQRAQYERALRCLKDADRALIVARLELGLTYEQIAAEFGKPNWNAARSAVVRALLKLAAELKRV